jgi:hypothetical protein
MGANRECTTQALAQTDGKCGQLLCLESRRQWLINGEAKMEVLEFRPLDNRSDSGGRQPSTMLPTTAHIEFDVDACLNFHRRRASLRWLNPKARKWHVTQARHLEVLQRITEAPAWVLAVWRGLGVAQHRNRAQNGDWTRWQGQPDLPGEVETWILDNLGAESAFNLRKKR